MRSCSYYLYTNVHIGPIYGIGRKKIFARFFARRVDQSFQLVLKQNELFSLEAFCMLRHYCCFHAARKSISFCLSLENASFLVRRFSKKAFSFKNKL